jgi:hypothetical protein
MCLEDWYFSYILLGLLRSSFLTENDNSCLNGRHATPGQSSPAHESSSNLAT